MKDAKGLVMAGMELAGLSDLGKVRARNEDAIFAEAPPPGRVESHGVLVFVADGMGGHPAGEVASEIARETVSSQYYGTRLGEGEDPVPLLRQAFGEASRRILAEGARNTERFGLGTTCTALLFRRGFFWMAHVGDSRAYLLRSSELRQLSRDHTLGERWVAEGKMSRKELEDARGLRGIVEYLGKDELLRADFSRQPREYRPGDRFLLCSDGLSNMLPEPELKALLRAGAPADAASALVEAANERGGRDNISVIVAEPVAVGEKP